MKAIDGSAPVTDVATFYPLPAIAGGLDVDFLYSDDLDTVESGASSLGRTTELLALVQGIAIVRVERDGLWSQGGFANLRAYRIEQSARLGMPRSTVSARRAIAEAWLTHKKILGKTSLEGNISKLPFITPALELHEDRKLVMDHFRHDTFEEFVAFARPDLRPAEDLPTVDAKLSDYGIDIEGETVLVWPSNYPKPEREWLGDVVMRAFKARSGGNMAHVVSVYDTGEARAVDNFLKKLRSGK